MRCPKCGNEVDFKAMECARCGLATPKGQKPTKGTTGKLPTGKLPTGKLKKPSASKNYLPKFLANSPLAKINVSSKLVVPLVLLFPLAAAVIYYLSFTPICINCAQVGGKYVMEFPTDDKKMQVELKLIQYEAALSGQVVFIPKEEAPVVEGQSTPAPANPPQKFVELIQGGSISNNNISFQSYPREGNIPRIQFSGQMEGTLLKGNLKVTIPDLKISNKNIPFSAQKQGK